MTFHVENGICFDRTANGGVRVFCRAALADDSQTTLVEMTASEWASVMAAVSRRGSETAALHQEALDFHNKP